MWCVLLMKLETTMQDVYVWDRESHIGEVSYICTDNYEVYSVWTKEHNWKHYVEHSSYRKERSAKGYVNTDNIYSQLSKEDYAKDRKINEQLYKEGRYPHIENTKRLIPYDEFIALKYKFGLDINSVNSYHNILEKDLVKNKTGVGSNYLQDYVLAYNYLANYKSKHNVSTFSRKDAESILVGTVKLTLANKYSPTRTDIENLNIDDLPRPSAKITNEAQRRMVKAREIINIEKTDDKDKSAYEADDTNAQFMFNKRKFFQAIGTIRLNELVKQYGLYQPHQTKRQKIDKMCSLENVQDIIFYEVYLHNYGSIKEFETAINTLPKKKEEREIKEDCITRQTTNISLLFPVIKIV